MSVLRFTVADGEAVNGVCVRVMVKRNGVREVLREGVGRGEKEKVSCGIMRKNLSISTTLQPYPSGEE